MGVAPSIVSALRARFDSFLKEGFVRSVGALVGGTAFAQAVMVFALPFLTRLYTPEDFSVLAVYVSILGIISVVACLRLEIAIPMPDLDEDAANLLLLALCFSALVAGIVAIVVGLFPQQITDLVKQSSLRPYLWLLPLGIWLSSSYAALQYWMTRKKKFPTIAKTRMTQAIGGAGTQLGLGWAGVSPLGLLLGHMISGGAGVLRLGYEVLTYDREVFRSIRSSSLRWVLGEYRRFPKYSSFEALANTSGIQLPVIIIAALALGPEAGFLMLATRVMQVPLGLIGGAVGQVYLSRAAQEFRAGNLGSFTGEVLGGLVKAGVGPLLFVGVVAPPAFALIFGEEWRRAGELVVWMTPWFVFQFLSSPISMVMHVRNWQKGMLIVTLSGLVLRVGAIGFATFHDRQHLAEYYAISGAVFYMYCYWIFSHAACVNKKNLIRIYSGALLPVASWVSMGVIFRLSFEYMGL